MKVNREELLRRLSAVEPGLSVREILEQSSCFVFRDGQVLAFNDEICTRAPSGLDDTFSGAVPAKKLTAILYKLKDEFLEVTQADGELVLAGKGRSRTGFRMEAEVTLPVDQVETPKKWRPLPPDFLHAVEIVQNCAGTNESEFEWTCVHIHPEHVEACDNFQMCRYRLEMPLKRPTLVRKESLRHVLPLGVSEVSETESWLHFRNQEVILSVRRFLEDYKDIGKFLEVEGEPCTLPKGLGKAADRAEVFSQENVDENQVRVELSPGRVRIHGKGMSGWHEEVKKAVYKGPPISFMIAPKLLAEVVEKHNQSVVGQGRLKVDGGKWTYVTCLGAIKDDPTANGRAAKGDPLGVEDMDDESGEEADAREKVREGKRKKRITVPETDEGEE